MSVVSLCRGLQGGEHVPAGSPRAGGGAHRGNSCINNPSSCSAPGPKKSVGFPLPLKGPWSKVNLPCVPYRSVRVLWDGVEHGSIFLAFLEGTDLNATSEGPWKKL